MLYLKAGDYYNSLEDFNKVLKLEQNNTAALNNIGVVFMLENTPEDAIPYFKKIIEWLYLLQN